MNTRVYENMMYEIQDHARVILIHVSAIVYSVRDDDSVTPWLGFYNKHIEAGLCVYVFALQNTLLWNNFQSSAQLLFFFPFLFWFA